MRPFIPTLNSCLLNATSSPVYITRWRNNEWKWDVISMVSSSYTECTAQSGTRSQPHYCIATVDAARSAALSTAGPAVTRDCAPYAHSDRWRPPLSYPVLFMRWGTEICADKHKLRSSSLCTLLHRTGSYSQIQIMPTPCIQTPWSQNEKN